MNKNVKKDKIIEKFEKGIYEYFEFIYPSYQKMLNTERAPYIKQIDSLSDLHLFSNYLLDQYQKFFNTKLANAFTLFYAKVASDIVSIRQCLLIGQLLSAVSIERNIFETYIDTKLILAKDTNERLILFADYELVQMRLKMKDYQDYITELENKTSKNAAEKKELNSLKEHFETLFKKEEKDNILANYNKVKDNYHPTIPYHWAWKIYQDALNGRNPTLSYICKSLGLYNEYLQVYTTNSLAVHNSPLMRNFLDKGKGITSTPNFSKSVESISGISLNYAVKIIVMILEYLKFPDVDEVRYYLEHVFKRNFII